MWAAAAAAAAPPAHSSTSSFCAVLDLVLFHVFVPRFCHRFRWDMQSTHRKDVGTKSEERSFKNLINFLFPSYCSQDVERVSISPGPSPPFPHPSRIIKKYMYIPQYLTVALCDFLRFDRHINKPHCVQKYSQYCEWNVKVLFCIPCSPGGDCAFSAF